MAPNPVLPTSSISFEFAGEVDAGDLTEEQALRAGALTDWMVGFFNDAIRKIVPKAIAYGSADLELMGKAMSQLNPQLANRVEGQELAVWFYVLGKVARLEGGYVQGIQPDVDSWWDLFVYSLMAHHIRETGGW